MRQIFGVIAMLLILGSGGAWAASIDDLTDIDSDLKAKLVKDYADSSQGCQANYTAAVSKDGSWGSTCSSKASDDDLARTAIQKCEHWSQGRPCGIVILRDTVVPYVLSPILMTYPTRFDAEKVPFLWASEREKLSGKFVPREGHKALAITRNGTYGWVVEKSTTKEAEQEALKDCENRDKKGRCFIYSIDDTVLFTSTTNIYPER